MEYIIGYWMVFIGKCSGNWFSGGREHALSWKLSQSKKVGTVFTAPGNGGYRK